ncbi:MAG TPA: hypothetical protein VK171_00685 [Fimbriimonas sp.]|nr:hypothetical protein [Fimbriimonas sp.]
MTPHAKGIGLKLASKGTELDRQFAGSLLEIVSVELFDVFQVCREHYQGVEPGKRAECVLDQSQKLNVVTPAGTVGNRRGDGKSRALNLL